MNAWKKNARDSDTLHIFADAEIQQGITKTSLDALIKHFGIKPEEIEPDFVFPHHGNPLDRKTFVVLAGGSSYFIDPASAHRVLAKTFERGLLDDPKLRERYLAARSRAMETLVAESARKVFPKATMHRNYYLQKGSLEKDIFILHERTVVLIECKNSRVRESVCSVSSRLRAASSMPSAGEKSRHT